MKKEKVDQDSLNFLFTEIKNDSVKRKFLSELSYFHLKNQDSLEFRKWNTKFLYFSQITEDTLALAEGHWDLGNFFNYQQKFDSSYYHYSRSSKFYKNIGNDFYSARMLLNQAIVQEKANDYLGSELTTLEAISLLRDLGGNGELYLAYNNLGIVYNNLGEYEKSL